MLATRFDPQKRYRYVRYGRMSSDLQNPRSPEQQFDTIAEVLRRRGHPWVHVKDYRDDGVSGRLARKRPGFQQMLKDIQTGREQVDLILVDTLERFGRMEDVAEVRRQLLIRHGVLVLTADSGFADPTGQAGQALAAIESIRATADGHVKAHNVRRGKRDAAKRRQWPGGPAPLGYRLESVLKSGAGPAEVAYHKLVPDPQTAPLVQRIFRLARERGWGGGRLARELNGDGDFVKCYGRTIAACTISWILANPIYIGLLRHNRVTTAIVDDRRVCHPNDPDEVVEVPDFCEPLIARDVWDAVQEARQWRSAAVRKRRTPKAPGDRKLIQPLAPGIVVKYPLTGLVRCKDCGASLRPTKPGKATYFYYGCPAYLEGRCTNARKVRGDWLWSVFVTLLRERLFPLPVDGAASPPGWLAELARAIRAELFQQNSGQADRRSLLERELEDLASQRAGWQVSLGNPQLHASVRQELELAWENALQREQQLQTELQRLDHARHEIGEVVDLSAAVGRLQRLHELLQHGNPSELNWELARHVKAILVSPNGEITLETSPLGIFEGAVELLALGQGTIDPAVAPAEPNARRRPRPAPFARRPVELGISTPASKSAPDMVSQAVELPERWTQRVVMRIPRHHCWASLHAAEVQQRRASEHWSQARLARHFGVTTPTIRHALRIAADEQAGAPPPAPVLSETPPVAAPQLPAPDESMPPKLRPDSDDHLPPSDAGGSA